MNLETLKKKLKKKGNMEEVAETPNFSAIFHLPFCAQRALQRLGMALSSPI